MATHRLVVFTEAMPGRDGEFNEWYDEVHLKEVLEVDQARAEALVGEENQAAAALILPEGLSKRYLASRPSALTLITDPVKGYELGAVKAWLLVADRDAASLADPFFEELLTLEERNATGSRLDIPIYESRGSSP